MLLFVKHLIVYIVLTERENYSLCVVMDDHKKYQALNVYIYGASKILKLYMHACHAFIYTTKFSFYLFIYIKQYMVLVKS